MKELRRGDRVSLEDGTLDVLLRIENDVMVRPDRTRLCVKAPLASVKRLFGPFDEVLVDGRERRVVICYSGNQAYHCREEEHGTGCDFYAWQLTPLTAEAAFTAAVAL
ncbi:hypothetical protein OG339_48440 (plasmid) [Streptosporangium sp. NBC_01495]|uniref:hypothetical protein n=1 Tax=Streptosporangium sp. NBC_01495 TaxID=2903899 RepID=UPI002E35B6FB|nr:hypothetical protein [Streptosporangium sp. NBC_01495]